MVCRSKIFNEEEENERGFIERIEMDRKEERSGINRDWDEN